MNNKKIINVLKILYNKLEGSVVWGIFGSTAITVHNGKFHRALNDIDIIIENNKEKIQEVFGHKVIFKKRNNRDRGYFTVKNINIDFILTTNSNEVVLADGKFRFSLIEQKIFHDIKLPVIDLQSLHYAKLRHRNALKNQIDKYQDKLKNTNKDISVLKKLLKKNHQKVQT